MSDDLGDRQKMLEQAEAGRRFLPLLPIMIRLDGKNFSSYTKNFLRPYDARLSECMVAVTTALVDEANARIGYTQSDEISLVLYSDTYNSQVFFDGKIQKLVSVLASMCSAFFARELPKTMTQAEAIPKEPAIFDCRAWTVPTKWEAANALLWREQDATKNAISMAARHYFSHKSLFKKTGSQIQERLFSEAGVNFNLYPNFFKRGTFVQRRKTMRTLSEIELARIPEAYRPTCPVERTEIVKLDMPPFAKVTNRNEVVFDGAEPCMGTL